LDALIDVLLDSIKDTAELVPFLFLTYLAMEAIEHGLADRIQRMISGHRTAGPVVGALLGALPQCGFSAMVATLYSARVVTIGTLVAVILSTSDEMLPVFVANQAQAGTIATIVGVKVVVGLCAGLVLDGALKVMGHDQSEKNRISELCEEAGCECGIVPEHGHAHTDGHSHSHGHAHTDGHAHTAGHAHGGALHIARCALVHTVEVTAFIFVITLAFGLVIELVGEDVIGEVLGVHPVRATLLAAVVGLIPNCGASVVISELYLSGTLPAGAMLAGLLVSGGMGLLVLYRTNSGTRAGIMHNIGVTAFVYAVGVACGLIAQAVGFLA